ncbi:MAG: S26 family signal peptidase [Bacteroidales bacterium]|nr:S26 family signal peptidase [Bacteroidales bacterium]
MRLLYLGEPDSQERLADTHDCLHEERSILKTFAHTSGWTIKNMGPLYVPKRGDVITMGEKEFDRYRLVIEYETGGKLLLTKDGVYLNDSKITEYAFRKNYYFAVGDNVFNSRDSRYIGFVPEEYVVGIATRILYSRDKQTNRIKWERVWLKI